MPLLSGAKVETNNTIAKPPSDVTVYVSVKDSGKPVGHLSADNFHIYENDVLLSESEIGLRLLSRDTVAAGFTVLLLDLSGAPSAQELARIGRGAAHFVQKVSTTQPVTVVAFDGSPRAREVARFSRVEQSTKRDMPSLKPFLTKDTSRDLNSALSSALKGLETSLKSQKGEVHYGTLVTLVRGPDLAGRTSDKDVVSQMAASGYEFYSLSPEDVKFKTLNDIGKTERFTYSSIDTLPMRFQDLGIRVRSAWQSHYLISYCTPARAGTRKVKVKVTFDSESGAKRSASTKSEFDATGFEAGCALPGAASSTSPSGDPSPPSAGAETSDSPSPAQTPPEPKATPKKSPAKNPSGSEPPPAEDESVVAPPPSGKYE